MVNIPPSEKQSIFLFCGNVLSSHCSIVISELFSSAYDKLVKIFSVRVKSFLEMTISEGDCGFQEACEMLGSK